MKLVSKMVLGIKILIVIPVLFLSLICESQNLIQNPSFEENGIPTGEHWFSTIQPIPLEYFENNTPEGGGLWSLKLNTWSRSLYYAETYLTNFSGQNIFQLTGWMKTSGWNGVISLGKISSRQIVQEKIIISDTTTWTKFVIVDTMNLQIDDTVRILLSSTYTPWMKFYQYFDLIELKNLSDTLNVEDSDYKYPISIFPNPFHEKTQVLLNGNFDKTLRFSLSSMTGEIVVPLTFIEGNKFVISRGFLSDGIYILSIWDSQHIIANTKVIVN